MKRLAKILFVVMSFLLSMESIIFAYEENVDDYICNTKRDLLVLMVTYPECIKDIEKDEYGFIYLIMQNNNRVLYDDKKEKSHEQKFYNSDLQDTLEQIYPLDMITDVMEEGEDPGRIRSYSFLSNMYGGSKEAVQKNITNKSTYYGTMMFNKVNGAADNLEKALNKVSELAKQNTKIYNFVSPTSGTFNYRVIQDTGQLSPHAFAIAIDLKSDPADYWKWCNREKGGKRISIYPEEIVKTFEECGFVWGGKWAHFDILHFEYRPEIILKARYFGGNEVAKNKEWYEGCEINQDTEALIDKINSIIDN
ncbi:Uncharacterised protein [uncultured Clostridium sp.]|uniref:M15 family metallopeptidase n=1 Tax=uncultured Clostridium sp. TaxID=59620 RepID=UPI00082299F2|nr:M15 family metallopeptidase [uncultured Clostridium sp.]SCJ62084.1 Uncharacterised protein [uncultured Clostridium sp.]